jgi:hypothetical protein
MEERESGVEDENACKESADELAARHKRETRELETRIRFMLKQAKKSKKAEIDAEVIIVEHLNEKVA